MAKSVFLVLAVVAVMVTAGLLVATAIVDNGEDTPPTEAEIAAQEKLDAEQAILDSLPFEGANAVELSEATEEAGVDLDMAPDDWEIGLVVGADSVSAPTVMVADEIVVLEPITQRCDSEFNHPLFGAGVGDIIAYSREGRDRRVCPEEVVWLYRVEETNNDKETDEKN